LNVSDKNGVSIVLGFSFSLICAEYTAESAE